MRRKDAAFAALGIALALGWATLLARAWPAIAPSTSAEDTPRPTGAFDTPRLPGRIAFVAGGDVYVVRDGRSTPVTVGGGYREPSLSLDGTRIAYTAADLVEGRRIVDGQNVPGHLAYESVVARPTAGGAEEVLVDGLQRRDDARGFHVVEFEMQPAWSPDGTELAFISDDGNGADLQVLTLATGAVRTLSRGSVLADPAWSPDGSALAVTTYSAGEPGILVVPASGGAATALELSLEGQAYRPSYSPDGRWLLVTVRSGRGNDLVAVEVDGARTIELTTDGRSWGGVFSPDGDRVAFLQDREGTIDVFVLELDRALAGGPPGRTIRLTRGGVDGHSRPSWSR